MGLKMTLPSDKNHLATTFLDAYWVIVELGYDFNTLTLRLACFPSREAKQLNGTSVENPSIGNYGSCKPTYNSELYSWTQILFISDVFPNGIPLGRDEQLKVLYTFIKGFTGLPFEDVLEEGQVVEEPTEPIVEPSEPTEPTEPIGEPIEEPSAAEEVADEETVTEEATETTEEETEDVE